MGISLKQNTAVIINPVDNMIPLRINSNTFGDSVFEQTGSNQKRLHTIFNDVNYGLSLAQFNDNIIASLGDYNGVGNETALIIDDDAGVIHLKGLTIISSPGVVTPTANFLQLTINGTNYLIALSI